MIRTNSVTLRICTLCCLLAGIIATDAVYVQVKAALAQHLLARAWRYTLQNDGTPQRPWPWADTSPVARLKLAAANLDTFILDGSSGTSLAFGPGRVSGSVEPGEPGTIVIGAHRDTHFSTLRLAETGDSVRLQDRHLRWHEYRINRITIADVRSDKIVARTNAAKLLLVTCYPFDALVPGGPLRYVLEADLISNTRQYEPPRADELY